MSIRPASLRTGSLSSAAHVRRLLSSRDRRISLPASADDPPLKLSHPTLRLLDSRVTTVTQFHQAHAQLVVSGLVHHPLASGRAILRLLAISGSTDYVVSIFAHLNHVDAFVCNVVVRTILESRGAGPALEFYRRHVLPLNVVPNHYTFPLLAKMFAEAGATVEGDAAHARVLKMGLESDVFVRNSLIHMYSLFGNVGSAQRVFDLACDSQLDLVSWNSMVSGYVRNSMVTEARKLFDRMLVRDGVSWNMMISAHAGVGEMEKAEELFSLTPRSDIVSWNALLVGYAKLDEVVPARLLFDIMPERNLASWNTMLALYVRKGNFTECLRLFETMMTITQPNEATLVSVLTACGHLGRLDVGQWIHSLISESCDGTVRSDMLLSTALLTMYAKCGDMDSAKAVFDGMLERSVVSWNSMMMGYALHGLVEKAFNLFLEMERDKAVTPNEATLVCLLCGCVHAGMVLEGWWIFDRMVRVHGIQPNLEHYGCMVDLLGRAGMLGDSKELVKDMVVTGDQAAPKLMGAVLSACRTQSNWKLGEIVGKMMLEVEHNDVGCHVLLSNIYAAQGRWDDVEEVRIRMREKGLVKVAGLSSIGTTEDSSNNNKSMGVKEICSSLKKGMMYSMLGNLGAQIKLTYRAC